MSLQLRLRPAGELISETVNPDSSVFRIFHPTAAELESMVYPPVLFRGEILVWGFDVIESAAAQDPETLLPVYDLGECMWYAVFLAMLLREDRCDAYSFREMDRLDQLMTRYELSEEQKRSIDPLVQRKGSFRAHLQHYRSLPQILQESVNNGKCDVRTAQSASNLPESVLNTLMQKNLGFSSRRILLTWLSEILKRDRLDSASAIALTETLLASDDSQEYLKSVRYPELTSRLQKAASLQNRDSGNSRVRIELPENLEGDSIKISCFVRSVNELDEQIVILSKLREKLHEYLDLL